MSLDLNHEIMENTRRKATVLGAIIAGGLTLILGGVGILTRNRQLRTVPPEPQALSHVVSPGNTPSPKKSKVYLLVQWLSATGTALSALAAVAALGISLVTLEMQLQDRNSAQETAREEYAQKISFWWTLNKKHGVDVHIQNSNSLPVAAWIAHFPDDLQSAPGTAQLQAFTGEISFPPTIFVGEIPPCTIINISNPFAKLGSAKSIAPFAYASLLEGDMIMTDPTGNSWVRTLAERLQPADAMDLMIAESDTYTAVPWQNKSTAPTCS